jgi:hypothetical protein
MKSLPTLVLAPLILVLAFGAWRATKAKVAMVEQL